jgi:universal stress protein A
MTFKRIIVAVDGSATADRAADQAIELAKSLGATMALVHVVDPDALPVEGASGWAEHDGRNLLAALVKRATLEPSPAAFVPIGKPAAEIVAAAREWRADLIVIGSHGRGRVARMLIGSVATAVIHHAPCPVLVVPPMP